MTISKTCASCLLEQPLDQFAPFKRGIGGKYSYCRGCVRIRNKQFYAKNKEREKIRASACRKASPDKVKTALLNWRKKNKEHEIEYRKANAAKFLEAGRKCRKQNPAVYRAGYARRRAAVKSAVPAWADHDQIKQFYKTAALISKASGVRHEVDHIVPLQSKYVCGLHNHFNLQVIPMSENRVKCNIYWPDMPVIGR